MSAPSPRAPRALLLALAVVLLASFALAGWLGWSHVHLTHGLGAFESGCNAGGAFDCDKVNTSGWSELRGVPISFWALPLYAAMGALAVVGRRADERGARARGGMLVIAGWNALVSLVLMGVMVLEIEAFCAFCLTLDLLHFAALGLIWGMQARRPRLPEGVDLFYGAGAAVFTMAFSFQFIVIWAEKLDREAIAATIQPIEAPAGADVAVREAAGQAVALPGTVHDVPVDRFDPNWGPHNAAVTVVEFADFECSYCRRLRHTMATMKERYGDRVRFVFKHYPMDQACNSRLKRQHHPSACLAATASICAHDQGQFWEYHDLLFKNQKHLERDDLIRHAQALGLDLDSFQGCLDGNGAREQLTEDISHGGYLEITGTPRTFVNGRMFKGAVSEGVLDAAIRHALGEVEADASGRVPTRREVAAEPPLSPGPVDMVPIPALDPPVWIDAVEASIDDEGRAVAIARATPPAVSWTQAAAACSAAGKRICSVGEWLAACQGAVAEDDDGDGRLIEDFVEGRSYPYGDRYRSGYCHDTGSREAEAGLPAGSRGACRTPEGAHDLAGNLQEWAGSSRDEAVLLGGAWYWKDKASCGASYDTYGPDMANRTTGFRCCADAPVAAPAVAQASPAAGARLIEVGQQAPALERERIGGGTVSLAALEGKVVLLNFWASWCGPCRKELPALVELHRELAPSGGFEVLAVNVDRDEASALRFLGGRLPPFPVVLDPDSEIVGQYDVMAMPTSVLIGAGGQILARHEGYSEAWMAELADRVRTELAQGGAGD